MSEPIEFGAIDNSKLTGLVLELAAQLHVERTRRLALEAALARSGVLESSQIEIAADSPEFRKQSGEQANDAVCRLLRVLSESGDERKPLRGDDSRQGGGS